MHSGLSTTPFLGSPFHKSLTICPNLWLPFLLFLIFHKTHSQQVLSPLVSYLWSPRCRPQWPILRSHFILSFRSSWHSCPLCSWTPSWSNFVTWISIPHTSLILAIIFRILYYLFSWHLNLPVSQSWVLWLPLFSSHILSKGISPCLRDLNTLFRQYLKSPCQTISHCKRSLTALFWFRIVFIMAYSDSLPKSPRHLRFNMFKSKHLIPLLFPVPFLSVTGASIKPVAEAKTCGFIFGFSLSATSSLKFSSKSKYIFNRLTFLCFIYQNSSLKHVCLY